MHTEVLVFGAAGYSGIELLKLLSQHPHVRIVAAASDTHAGRALSELTGLAAHSATTFVKTEAALALAPSAKLAFLAIPAEPAREIAKTLLARGLRVVDLSDAHRKDSVYGMTALFSADVAEAPLVANPGCYATAIVTALAPFVRRHLLDPKLLIVSAASGVTGAGRQKDESYSVGELANDMRPYKVLRHQHIAEIEAALGRVAEEPVRVCLTTHLLPTQRGILATITTRLLEQKTSAQLTDILREDYASDPFVTVARTPEEVSLRRVVGTNQCAIGVASEPHEGGFCVITASVDNLLKGAAGQAVENMNLMLGYPRALGFSHLSRHS
jgi:N-acetyl-gamma-glutamyl-phosphate reductase